MIIDYKEGGDKNYYKKDQKLITNAIIGNISANPSYRHNKSTLTNLMKNVKLKNLRYLQINTVEGRDSFFSLEKMRNTDLHTHSYYSDGELSPKELVRLAKKKSILNLALTDHNSVKGVEEAISEGKKIGINVIPGVEVLVKGGEILGFLLIIKIKN